MNETGHKISSHGQDSREGNARVRWGAVAAVLVTACLWTILGGCADPRTEPTTPPNPGHTETIVLWQNQAMGAGGMVSAAFNVDAELAPIVNPLEDRPARVTVVAYIEPDCQILRREQIMLDSLGYLADSMIVPRLAAIIELKDPLPSEDKARIDSIEVAFRGRAATVEMSVDTDQQWTEFGGISCDSVLYGFHYDPATQPISPAEMAILTGINADLAAFESQYARLVLDTTRLGAERDYLAQILDNRYTLAIALDNSDLKRFPDAVYSTELSGALTGQEIFAAATDSASGMKGRGFDIALNQFSAADVNNLGEALEVNWVTCFPGSEQPCLSPGAHTMYAWVTGSNARVTGTIVLVYAEER